MPPRKKDLTKPKPKGKTKASEPHSENDFLEAADEHEQAAGKWRAGDAAKATRFFHRAIDTYTEGLKRHPQSFDLAYNKANLEFNLTEDERIIPHLGNRTSLLEQTLKSHRFAISLNPSNIDILFNTAQVLTSLAEAQLEDGTPASGRHEARPFLEEAVQLFAQCLKSQQQDYAQIQADIARAQASGEYQDAWEGERQQSIDAQDDSMDMAPSSPEAPGDWATVEEPLTPEIILETCTAQLGAITTLLGLYDPNVDLSSMEKIAQDGLETANNHIPALLDLTTPTPSSPSAASKACPTLSLSATAAAEQASTTPQDDALLAAANFQASLAEIAYRSGRSTPVTYAQDLERIFSSLDPNINAPVPAPAPASTPPNTTLATLNIRSAYADALIDLASAVADSISPTLAPPAASNTDMDIPWTALTQAQFSLTYVSTAPHVSLLAPARLADVFLARGDIELFRFRLSSARAARPAWTKSRAVLAGNAGVYYRGAKGYAEKGVAGDVVRTAEAKAMVAEVLRAKAETGVVGVRQDGGARSAGVARVLEQMVLEGVVGREEAEAVVMAMG